MSFSFGSFGDILALAQLAYTVAKTVSDSRGSSAEYQELILELHSLSAALEGLHRYLSNRGPVRLEYSAENAIKFALLRCEALITDFSKRIEGYQGSLQKGGSGSRMKDSWRKIGWGIFRREEIVDLKKKLTEQKATINMMLSLSNCTALDKIDQMLHGEINNLQEQKRVLQQKLDDLMRNYTDILRSNSPPVEPPEVPPPPEAPPAKPGWRTVTQRSRRKKKKGPDLSITTPESSSWASWQPDPDLILTPPSVEPILLVPDRGSPGLFGPRSPRSSYER